MLSYLAMYYFAVWHCCSVWPSACTVLFPERPSVYTLIQWVGPITSDTCGPEGWQFNQDGVQITIPPGSVRSHIGLVAGLTLAGLGPFEFPNHMKPVSPLLFICTGGRRVAFEKQVEVTLPHCVRPGRNQLQFLKAGHSVTSHETFVFHPTDGITAFSETEKVGTMLTNHFCLFCIAEELGDDEISNAEYALVKVVPRPITSRICDVVICAIYVLETCLKTVRQQYPDCEVDVHPDSFTFRQRSDRAKLKLTRPTQTGRHIRSGHLWMIRATPKEMKADDIDFRVLSTKKLKNKEKLHLYPPRILIKVSGIVYGEDIPMELEFRGANKKLIVLESLQLDNDISPRLSSSGASPSPERARLSEGTPVTDDSLPLLLDLLEEISPRWQDFALQLNIPQYEICKIRVENHTNGYSCTQSLCAALQYWMNNSDTPAYEDICRALRTRSVHNERLAEKIAKNFCHSHNS